MANEFALGFVEGFAGTLASNIQERNKSAREYFDKQLEYARTTGMANRKRVKDAVQGDISIARQLEAAGVPKEIIMAQVNANPGGLGDFYNNVEKIRAEAAANGKTLTPESWNGIFTVSGSFKAPEEDIATFISRSYDPIAVAVSSPDFEDDPKGNLFSAMMGYGAMDRARQKLGKTVVADGLTAEQLINYGDEPQFSRQGGEAVVTTNYDALQTSAGKPPKGKGDLSGADLRAVDDYVGEVAGAVEGLVRKWVVPPEQFVDKIMEDVKTTAFGSSIPEDVLREAIEGYVAGKPDLFKDLPPPPPGSPLQAQPTPSATPVAPETGTPSPGLSDAPIDPEAEPQLFRFKVEEGVEFVFDRPHPTNPKASYYRRSDTGEMVAIPNAKARELASGS